MTYVSKTTPFRDDDDLYVNKIDFYRHILRIWRCYRHILAK
jgi:hypothetical protein